jgi:hypothetical protein
MDIRVYIHEEGRHDPDFIDTQFGAEVGVALEIDGGSETFVLLEDEDEPIDLALTFDAAGIGDRKHVFRGKRKRVAVTILFNGERRKHEFSASTRVKRVFRWATSEHGFDLSDADAAEHTLALPDNTIPASDAHIGSLDDATPGHVEFRLIPKHRYEG